MTEIMSNSKNTASSDGSSSPNIASNYGKYRDRNQDMVAAGKLITMPGETARDCLNVPRVQTPDVVKKFRNFTQSEPQERRVFYGRAADPDVASSILHGVTTTSSQNAGDLVNPEPKSLFKQKLEDKKEENLYASKKKAPLGSSHDQRIGLPEGMDPTTTTLGTKNVFDCTAGELVSPPKTYTDVMREDQEGKDLYKFTHHEFEVGESLDRNYDWTRYPKDMVYGIPTPHNNDGKHVAKSLTWLRNNDLDKGTKVVSKRVDDFRERTQPQLGTVHDPIRDTMNVTPDHSFGILIRPDEYGAGDLIHSRLPGEYLRGKDRQRGLLAAVRQQLKKANYHNFNNLQAAFKHYDKNGDGKIDVMELRECCLQFNLPVETELLEELIHYCDEKGEGAIDYTEFANFLNWKDKMVQNPGSADGANKSEVGTPERLNKQIDGAVGQHRTSSSRISAVVGGVSTKDFRKYGTPTIRSDLPAPRIKRISDLTNYGDEADALGLINPSIYSNRGVYEKDFFQPRSQEQIQTIFKNVGTEMDNETFQKIWQLAAENGDGNVSVESFRNVLDDIQGQRLADMA
ncbi:EF-hand domain-containing family member B-like [Apostichopus japonicus]|uniref:EF-hand domain-containing family member B-like n=1 Tax=Stichopus japonicus TaxID=307972 RepID=UPI003AB860E6